MPYATGMKRSKQKTWDPKLKCFTYAWMYAYGSFTDSTKSFLNKYGKYVRNPKSAGDFLSALQKGGFNRADPEFLDPKVLNQAADRLKCPG